MQGEREQRPESAPKVASAREPAAARRTATSTRRAPVRLPSGVQAKLVVGSVDDPLEREADIAADRVVAEIRRAADRTDGVAAAATDGVGTSRIRRSAAPALADPLGGGPLDDRTSARIQSARSGGAPLPDAVRAPMERSFGRSLDDVRVHTGGEAADLSTSIQAKAFTTGSDIFFGAGQYQPGSADGQRLLAHEVAHTVQQDGSVGRAIARDPDAAPSGPDPAVVAAATGAFSSLVQVVSVHLAALTPAASALMAAAGAALANPLAGLGAIEAMRSTALAHLGALKALVPTLGSAWEKVASLVSAHPAVSALAPIVQVMRDLPNQLITWEVLVLTTGPGAMGQPAVVMTEAITAQAVLNGMMPMAMQMARTPVPASPSASAPPAPAPAPALAPAESGNYDGAYHELQPSAPAPVVSGGGGGGLVEEALAAPDVNKPPKVYPYTKAKDPHYRLESTEGSADLPLIIKAGQDAVAAKKVASIDEFMIKGFGWSQADVDKYVKRGDKATVTYLDPKDRIHFELFDGSPMTQGMFQDVWDTSDMFSKHSGKGFGIYVMDASGNMYGDQHKVGLFHHSSFLAGGDVAGAGEIKVQSGTVKWVTNKTGHYKAGEQQLWQVLDELKGRGVNLSGVEVSTFDTPRGQSRPGGAAQFYEDFKTGA